MIGAPGYRSQLDDLHRSPPLVSVVVIFFNEKQFLGEAVESVLAQTYPTWELLLVDDGSLDGSTTLAQAYAAREPRRIRYLGHPGHENRGMSASRNAGLGAALGQYVVFLDADDVLVPTALAEQTSLLMAHPTAAMVYGPAEWWYSWRGEEAGPQADRRQALGVVADQLVDGPSVLAAFLLHEGVHPTGPLYRRDALRVVGDFEAQFRGMYEDQVVRVKLCLRFPSYVSSRCWYRYRQHDANCCVIMVRNHAHLQARARFLAWVGSYLTEQGDKNGLLWRAYRRARWQNRYGRALEIAHDIGGPMLTVAARIQVWFQSSVDALPHRAILHE